MASRSARSPARGGRRIGAQAASRRADPGLRISWWSPTMTSWRADTGTLPAGGASSAEEGPSAAESYEGELFGDPSDGGGRPPPAVARRGPRTGPTDAEPSGQRLDAAPDRFLVGLRRVG